MGRILWKSKEKTEYRSLMWLMICIDLVGYGTIEPQIYSTGFR